MTNKTKIQSLFSILLVFCFFFCFNKSTNAQSNYRLKIDYADHEDSIVKKDFVLQTEFDSRLACVDYLNKLQATLSSKGYVTASLDNIVFDSVSAHLVLFLGRQYKWAHLKIPDTDQEMLLINGWNQKILTAQPINLDAMNLLKEKTMNYMENNGYPFAKIYLDSIKLIDDSVFAVLKIEKGPLYKIDSIRVFGNAKISNNFLQHYLGIQNGSIYKKDQLLAVSKKISELNFLEEEQPSNISLLGTGSVLNLYLRQKRSSQINFLIGFLPNNDQFATKKILITGEANINLKNAFGSGEAIGLNWQQLQVKSPRLNIFYQQPYLFNSPFGLNFSFDMFRKDSSFLNINMNAGARYMLSDAQSGMLYIQKSQTVISLGGINDAKVIASRRLPEIADMNIISLGIEFEKNKTNYRNNPRTGYEFKLNASAGTKKIKKNNQIIELKDPNDPGFDFESLYDTLKLKSYQLRFRGTIAKYIPVGKQGTIKTEGKIGLFQSENIFRNELFQVGGYKTLRGFDEESEYVSQFAFATLEYRYLIGLNSYFFGFADGGWAKNASTISSYSHTYISTGIGIAFETKAGIFNLAFAVGKRDDKPFNLRQSKIHFGFVNYF